MDYTEALWVVVSYPDETQLLVIDILAGLSQVIKTFSMRKLVAYRIGIRQYWCKKEGNKQGSNKKGKFKSYISPICGTVTLCLCAKYRTITFPLLIKPLFPSFLHQYCLIPILYATNFPIENVFITCFICF